MIDINLYFLLISGKCLDYQNKRRRAISIASIVR